MRTVRGVSRGARILVPVALFPLLTSACGDGAASESGSNADAPVSEAYVKVVNVEATRVEPRDFTAFVRITGEAEAEDDITVSAQEGGLLVRFFAEKGERVGRGAPIAKIDDEILQAQVEEARAAAALDRERFLRQKQVWEEERIGSEITFLQTRYQAEQSAARVALLESRLERTTVRAPVAGILDDRYVDAGEIVSPGTQVARVVDTSRLKITGGVPERLGPFIEVGGSALITFDVIPDRVFEGTIAFAGASVDPRSRTFPIEILMDNPDGAVKPRMIANVRVATETLQDVIVVPQEVIMRTESGYQLFVVTEREGEAIAEARAIQVGPSLENQVVVESGIDAGDLMVTRGHQLVDAGDRVAIVGSGGGDR
ncbi:MAG: efflux RND transporter periplasmic adaptor subunit [marine benthic group bacterium]|nr:efflux RND transporter periplasmic adaptor subunit [Gemmatimonadota bacterium]